MRLDELFDDGAKMSMSDRLQQAALDILVPLKAHQVPFVTVQKVIDELRASRPGIVIDRATVMNILDPTTCKAVEKIEGDRIYLAANPEGDAAKSDEQDAENNIAKVKQNAIAQAKKNVQSPAPGA